MTALAALIEAASNPDAFSATWVNGELVVTPRAALSVDVSTGGDTSVAQFTPRNTARSSRRRNYRSPPEPSAN
jgi:hypothetical protein